MSQAQKVAEFKAPCRGSGVPVMTRSGELTCTDDIPWQYLEPNGMAAAHGQRIGSTARGQPTRGSAPLLMHRKTAIHWMAERVPLTSEFEKHDADLNACVCARTDGTWWPPAEPSACVISSLTTASP